MKSCHLGILLFIITASFLTTEASAQLYSSADKINRVTTTGPVLQPVARPDLMPIGVSTEHTGNSTFMRDYDITAYVANIGDAEAIGVYALFGMRVLATTDPVKYPVGFTCYVGYAEFGNIPSLDYADAIFGSMHIPISVTKCEIVLIVDRPIESFDDTWLNDTGDIYRGSVLESNEDNNISAATVYDFSFSTPKATRVFAK